MTIDLDKIDLNTAAPAEEPERQYYFLAKCREWVRNFEQKNGYLPRSHVTTFGCQMNARDSEKLEGILKEAGFMEEPDEKKADFVIFNTCTVRENANQRLYGRLGQLNRSRKQNPDMKIALCGCMMQEAEVLEKLKKSYSFVSLVFGTHNIYKFAELLFACLESDRMVIDVWEDTDRIIEDIPSERKFSFKSGVNIMTGCNNFCSYCIVPYVRGRERSREAADILREIQALAADGVVEVMLLGQNVNSYGKTLEHPVSFAKLLTEIEQIDGLERIRFMTSHPKDLSDELIEVMGKSKKICRHLHLPVQSGSTRILEKMNRRYTKEHYLELTEKIRRAVPDISLTTDIIVGFPGETEEDFQETLDIVRRVRYDAVFTFQYSRRSGTPAAVMEGQVTPEVMKDRFDRLLTEVQAISSEVCSVHTGSVQEVLVESVNAHDPGLLTGRMSNNLLVHFPGDSSLIGKLISVRLKECRGFYYLGEGGNVFL
ncbi:tRNA (N6-isopentenyl adenosine(37)-C2)-methylthiotransferase MiaB [Lachnospiraceae bacterium]|jgi:tRNA-2-methylthio-N6-dimethylallyladenosine synthase|nr:tRNA (N6-isopentenyl adenosine(37)-C2)-methylthiotransferase MiaB [uncultured Schaedlerella sp.]EOS41209.1 tRNA-I(6)A37 thiotransferase enzyme MiaB [Lachnospiraceae bacterium M18-1]MCI9152404.1 tRNA (N6-isopentenyl adenosine(37)-C2)-methylthiotransferase MiaB [Ruminococcus sp.]NBI59832.1 tRNA (N6-isopentenyl adenosine(37)-C2)-methylthiotransferase MiaB [Lachnospiraceae bacterium]